jgi:hypothetical protein
MFTNKPPLVEMVNEGVDFLDDDPNNKSLEGGKTEALASGYEASTLPCQWIRTLLSLTSATDMELAPGQDITW